MKQEKSVIVLGAGASKPYGFPLGHELREALKHQVMPHSNKLIACGLKLDDLKAFNHVLTYGTFDSVDELLETKEEFREVGGFAIALTMFPLENFDKIFPANDWYLKFFNLLKFKSGDDASWLTIVTFNYDRSLEHFLAHSIEMQCHPSAIDSARRKLNSIKIIHPHGSLGDYPKVPYGLQDAATIEQIPESQLKDAAERIKLVHENVAHTPEYQEAQLAIGQAARVFFIGFGYEQRSLERLFSQSDYTSWIAGTTLNLPSNHEEKVREFFKAHKCVLEPKSATDVIERWDFDGLYNGVTVRSS